MCQLINDESDLQKSGRMLHITCSIIIFGHKRMLRAFTKRRRNKCQAFILALGNKTSSFNLLFLNEGLSYLRLCLYQSMPTDGNKIKRPKVFDKPYLNGKPGLSLLEPKGKPSIFSTEIGFKANALYLECLISLVSGMLISW